MKKDTEITVWDRTQTATRLLTATIQQVLFYCQSDGKEGTIVGAQNAGDILTQLALEALALRELIKARDYLDQLERWIEAGSPEDGEYPIAIFSKESADVVH